MDEGELTMIFLDTFYWLRDWNTSCWFHDQINAAQIYCERKLQAHPNNLVGIVTFGKIVSDVVVHPTKDLESIRKILACLGTEVSQPPDLFKGIDLCSSAWDPYQQMRKRVLVFSAGPVLANDVWVFASFLKKSRAVVDVVHFGYRPKGNHYRPEENHNGHPEENLKALVNAMNDNNNNKDNEDSRFFSIEDDGFSLSHHISSSSILQPQAKIHTSVGEEEVVDSDWYGEEVVYSDWYGEEVVYSDWGEQVFDSGWDGEPELKNTKLTHESSTATIFEEQQRSSKWDWLDASVHELSTDDSNMTSQREALSAEISEEGSPDDVIRKLKGELVILSRQAEVSDMELQTLRKQIVKESKKGQDLSKEVASLKEERNKMKEEFEKMKVKVNINSNLSNEGGDPWALVDELKQELNHEKDLNSNLRLQLQKTQESNAELILAVQDLDEMLEQKQKSNCSVDPKSQEVNTKPETDDDDDEDQKALMEIVREHSGLQDVHLQEQKIIDLYNEIELYKRDKDDLEMQMEQIALDYEILKQENHDMSYKLEQSEIQEQLKMQYECSTSYATVNELEAHIEHLDNELKTKSKELSESVLAIKELETLVKNLEEDLDNQAHGFEADMEDLIRAKVEQEQRAIRAEDNLRKVKLQNANTAGKLQEEFRRLSTEMSSAFKENESAVMRAMDEATQLRVEKRNLEEMIKKLQEELQYLGEQYEDKLVNLSNQLTLKSQQFDECNANFEKLQAENQNLDGERHSLENEIRVVKTEMSELRNVKKDKDNEVERLQSDIERLKTRCNDMKQFFKECESEKENLKKQVSQLKGDLKKKDEAVSIMEKKLKEASKLAARNNKPVPVSRTLKEVINMKDRIKLLEDQIKLKESALEFSEASFLEKEKDLQHKIEELEKRLEILDQHTENPQVSTADQTRDQEISEATSNEMELLNKNKSMETELKEMQERYSEISLKFAEVEGERQQLVMTLRNIKNAKKC